MLSPSVDPSALVCEIQYIVGDKASWLTLLLSGEQELGDPQVSGCWQDSVED